MILRTVLECWLVWLPCGPLAVFCLTVPRYQRSFAVFGKIRSNLNKVCKFEWTLPPQKEMRLISKWDMILTTFVQTHVIDHRELKFLSIYAGEPGMWRARSIENLIFSRWLPKFDIIILVPRPEYLKLFCPFETGLAIDTGTQTFSAVKRKIKVALNYTSKVCSVDGAQKAERAGMLDNLYVACGNTYDILYNRFLFPFFRGSWRIAIMSWILDHSELLKKKRSKF